MTSRMKPTKWNFQNTVRDYSISVWWPVQVTAHLRLVHFKLFTLYNKLTPLALTFEAKFKRPNEKELFQYCYEWCVSSQEGIKAINTIQSITGATFPPSVEIKFVFPWFWILLHWPYTQITAFEINFYRKN